VPVDHLLRKINQVVDFSFGAWGFSQGEIGTDRLFTGQRLDGTGLYYYGARYYDPGIGIFVSPDTIVPSYANPQSLNRYSYCLNNPLKYIDPSGHVVNFTYGDLSIPTQLWYSNDPYIYTMVTQAIYAHGGQTAAKELAEYSMLWNDFKEEVPVIANAMEKATQTYNWNSSTTLEVYTPESQMIYPGTRSTTQIEGLPDINRGYQDLSITFGGITLGLMYYRQGKDMVVYPYFGDTTAVGGVSYTGSLNDISSYGVGAALQVGYGGTIQLGGSLGVDGPSGFFEYGLSLPPGVSGTAYFNIGPFVWNIPWHH
jgi:RHS repeat-associated protein